MPKLSRGLLIAVQNVDIDALHAIIQEYRRNPCDRPPFEEALCSAVSLGCIDIVRLLLRVKVNVAWVDQNGCRAIHYAAQLGSVKIIKLILNAGSPVNVVDKSGLSALHYAIKSANKDAVLLLLQEGANVTRTRTYVNGETPLHFTAKYGQADIAKFLLTKGANINQLTCDNATPLHFAIRGKHHALTELLCGCGANLDQLNSRGLSVLHIAVEIASVDMVTILLKHRLNVNIIDGDGKTPLHYAASRRPADCGSQVRIAEMLLRRGANVKQVDMHGSTPLHCAALTGHVAVAAVLLACGADVNQTEDSSGRSPLNVSITHDHHEMTRLLISCGADVRKPDEMGVTPLHSIQGAKGEEKMEIIDLLLSHGAKVNALSRRGYTPLGGCVFRSVIGASNEKVLLRLIQAGAHLKHIPDPGRIGVTHNSPLCWLTFRGDLSLARLLILAGWDLNSELWLHLPGKTATIEEFLSWLRDVARQPRELKLICRTVIRETINTLLFDEDISPMIERLPLPGIIRAFLQLSDVAAETKLKATPM